MSELAGRQDSYGRGMAVARLPRWVKSNVMPDPTKDAGQDAHWRFGPTSTWTKLLSG